MIIWMTTLLIRSSKTSFNRIIIKVVDSEWPTKDYKTINSKEITNKDQTVDQNMPKDFPLQDQNMPIDLPPPDQNSSIKSAPAATKTSNKSWPPDRTSSRDLEATRKTISKKDHMVDPESTVINLAIKVKVNIDQNIERN